MPKLTLEQKEILHLIDTKLTNELNWTNLTDDDMDTVKSLIKEVEIEYENTDTGTNK